MEATTEGVIAGLINQGEKQGIEKGEKNIIVGLLNKYSIEEISDMLDMSPFEIHRIIDKD